MVDLMQPTMQTNPAAGSVLLMETVKLLDTPNADRLQKAVKATLDPRIQEILDQDEVGEGGDPQVQAVKQQYEVQLQQLAMQLEQAGVTVQQLQEALKAAEQKLADRSEEMKLKAMDQENKAAESEAKLKADSERTQAEVLIAQIQAQSSDEVKEVRDELGALAKAVAGVEQAMKALAAKGNGKVEAAPVAPAPTMQPIVIPIGGGGNRKVTVKKTKEGQWSGEVTEGEEGKAE
jgi:chromosome segregation ATPase